MYIITSKEDNRIINTDSDVDYLSNGYPRFINKNIAFPIDIFNLFEAEIPSEVEAEKWCYDGERFYENENYVEPIEEVSEFEKGYEQALLDLMEMESEVTE